MHDTTLVQRSISPHKHCSDVRRANPWTPQCKRKWCRRSPLQGQRLPPIRASLKGSDGNREENTYTEVTHPQNLLLRSSRIYVSLLSRLSPSYVSRTKRSYHIDIIRQKRRDRNQLGARSTRHGQEQYDQHCCCATLTQECRGGEGGRQSCRDFVRCQRLK